MGYRSASFLLILIAALSAVRPCEAASGLAGDTRLPLVSVVDAPTRTAADRQGLNRPILRPAGDPLTGALDLAGVEAALLLDAADGQFDEHSLVEAGLLASGADRSSADRGLRKFVQAVAELRVAAAGIHHPSERLELVHRILYRRLLQTYDAQATGLAHTLETGVYNCASATLLFVALAREIDSTVAAVELPGHVRAMAVCDGARCEIEVTCRHWGEALCRAASAQRSPLDPQSQQGGRVAGHVGPDSEAATRREVSEPGLVAMIYYNRGIDAFYERRYADAVAENRRALLLDPANPVARGNMLAAVNNWALALSDGGDFDAAQALLADGLRFAPDHQPFAHNAAHVKRLRARTSRKVAPIGWH